MEPRKLKSRLRNVLMNSLIFKSCHIQEILRAKRRAQDDVPGTADVTGELLIKNYHHLNLVLALEL